MYMCCAVLPYIQYMTENKESGMLHTLRFYCRVQGVPLPTITWLKNGEVLENNGHVELKGDELVIVQGMASDSGLYQCFAENRVGMDQDTVRLDVEPAGMLHLSHATSMHVYVHACMHVYVHACCTRIAPCKM